MVILQQVTVDNWRACVDLSLHSSQEKFVASNVATIAESRFHAHYQLRAIYADERLVGMLAYCHEDDPEDLELYWIFRLMIDRTQQQNGYGSKAMRLAMEEIKERGGKRVRTMHNPDNAVAAAMYRTLGFRDIGHMDDGDCLLELEFPPTG